ncbi:hypothetical protein PILCRDRAFT_3427 [Piloderma croceum F 1598]|uniref:Uncharacterized protein n=1 Tax=Piloderma croceum (strain F 1598) TaxID=765440 RepID=A0A0C3GCQ9_PILCF|nr:hypothetical protein PILCRDRAFT_3427 [Piloderma croceum F 1598]
MSYGYDGPEYANYSAYDDGYTDSYSDHAESVYNDPDPINSEPDHYEDHKDIPEGHRYKYKGEVEGYELKELEHGEGKIDEYGEREHECEYEEEKYEPKGLKYEGEEGYEHKELAYEPKCDNRETSYAPGNNEHEGPIYHNVRTAPPYLVDQEATGEYIHTHFPSTPTPAPTPRARDTPCSNQQGHMTASKHMYMSNDGHDDDEP